SSSTARHTWDAAIPSGQPLKTAISISSGSPFSKVPAASVAQPDKAIAKTLINAEIFIVVLLFTHITFYIFISAFSNCSDVSVAALPKQNRYTQGHAWIHE